MLLEPASEPGKRLSVLVGQVWRQHHKEDVAERKKKHDAEVAELRRALENHRPYYAVYAQDKIR